MITLATCGLVGSSAAIAQGTEFAASEVEDFSASIGLQSDCSVTGIDNGTPAPVAEGDELLTIVKGDTHFDDQSYPFSVFSAYDCRSSQGLNAIWQGEDLPEVASERGQKILNYLRANNLNFNEIRDYARRDVATPPVGSLYEYQTTSEDGWQRCGCALHYGQEITQ